MHRNSKKKNPIGGKQDKDKYSHINFLFVTSWRLSKQTRKKIIDFKKFLENQNCLTTNIKPTILRTFEISFYKKFKKIKFTLNLRFY